MMNWLFLYTAIHAEESIIYIEALQLLSDKLSGGRHAGAELT